MAWRSRRSTRRFRPAESFPASSGWRSEKVRPKLAISLNASSNEQRDKIMPINRKYPIEKLLEACARYPLRPWEHLTFEYVLLGGFNDAPEDARRVAKLLANLRAKVNLIPWNPGELPYEKPDAARIEEFRANSCGQRHASFCALLARAGCDGCVRTAGVAGISGASETAAPASQISPAR